MFWTRLRALPRPLLVVIVIVPVLLLVAGTALVLSRLPRGQATSKPTPSTSAGASECPTPCPSICPSDGCPTPFPSPSPSPSSSAPQPQTTSSQANAPGCPSAVGPPPSGSIPASFPTAMAFAPDGRLFWAERSGTVKVWQGGAARLFGTVSVSTSGERGLLGLALTPSFASDHYVYAFYSRADDTNLQRVVRWTDCGGTGIGLTTIVDDLPAGSGCCHKGGRIAFSPDGFLFVTLGENSVPPAAQMPCDVRGKVLRYTAGGAAAGQCGPVHTLGLRNPFGIAFAPDGTLAVTNNGPSGDNGSGCSGCGDIVDIVGKSAGVEYQWPTCWGYGHVNSGYSSCVGNQPNYSTEKTGIFVAPTGMTYANGHFLFCADIGNGHVYQYNGQNSISDTGIDNCLLDVKQAPDGAIYTAGASSIQRH